MHSSNTHEEAKEQNPDSVSIQWKNLLVEEATWEDEEFIQKNPHLVSIEENSSFKRGGMLCP